VAVIAFVGIFIWIAAIGGLILLFVNVFIPTMQFSGRDRIPHDLPVYAGAQLTYASAFDSGLCTSVNASWSTGADQAAVLAFYRSALAVDPWAITNDVSRRGQQELDFVSDNGAKHREGALTIAPHTYDTGTDISVELHVPRSPTAGRSCVLTTAS